MRDSFIYDFIKWFFSGIGNKIFDRIAKKPEQGNASNDEGNRRNRQNDSTPGNGLPANDLGISITAKNSLIKALNYVIDSAQYFQENCEEQPYDILYSSCKDIFSAGRDILRLVDKYYMQLHEIRVCGFLWWRKNLADELKKIAKQLPNLRDTSNDDLGATAMYVVIDFTNFFCSKDGKMLVERCKSLKSSFVRYNLHT